MLIAYLDEFGHIGPYLSRTDEKHNDSPICEQQDTSFLLMMDEHMQRDNILSEASRQMFIRGTEWSAERLIEPPFQLESNRYQTAQAADWICGLIGRLGQYECAPTEYPEMAWARTYFQT